MTVSTCFPDLELPSGGTLTADISISAGPDEIQTSLESGELSAYFDDQTGDHNLERGYAPFGVMFRGTASSPVDGIDNWHWKLFDTDGTTILREYDAFNAAHVYDTAGTYNAELTISDNVVIEKHGGITFTAPDLINDANNELATFTAGQSIRVIGRSGNVGEYVINTVTAGQIQTTEQTITTEASTENTTLVSMAAADTDTTTKTVTVWARNTAPTYKEYYVDSDIGDDNYDGLSMTDDGGGVGPWKTATRALLAIAPREMVNGSPASSWTISDFATGSETVEVRHYSVGIFEKYRGSSAWYANMTKDASGLPRPAFDVKVYTGVSPTIVANSVLNPGDQILFNRGQTFDVETAIPTIGTTDKIANGITYEYKEYNVEALCRYGGIGINIGAYGSGNVPIIKNKTKESESYSVFHFYDTTFNCSFSDLEFDLETDAENLYSNSFLWYGNRASLATGSQRTVNIVFNNVTTSKMAQGLILNGGEDKGNYADGVFIFNSSFSNSSVTTTYTRDNYRNVAVVDCDYDLSGNHHFYVNLSNSLFYNNKISRPAFGRTAIRIAGYLTDDPNIYNWVGSNEIEGWADPRTIDHFGRAFNNGLRYNFTLLNYLPNSRHLGEETYGLESCVFTDNIASNYEIGLTIGANNNTKVFNNQFTTLDTRSGTALSMNPGFGTRPNLDTSIYRNVFSNAEVATSHTSIISEGNYDEQECLDLAGHTNTHLTDNTFNLSDDNTAIITSASLEKSNWDDPVSPVAPYTLPERETAWDTTFTITGTIINTPTPTAAILINQNGAESLTPNSGAFIWTSGMWEGNGLDDLGLMRAYNQDSSFYASMMGDTVINQA